MTHRKTCRPRISREHRDRLLDVSSQLNGTDVSGVPRAAELICRYLAVLDRDAQVRCPDCGEILEEKGGGNHYYCWHEDRYLSVFDVIGSENPEDARVFGLPRDVRYRFKPDTESEDVGTKPTENRQDDTSRTPNTTEPATNWHNTSPEW